MIAFDTNVLVYAHRGDSPFHASARDWVRRHAEGQESWAIPWPCLHEFLAIVTHPRIFKTPTGLDAAIAQVDAWLASPTLVLIGEDRSGYWELFCKLARSGKIQGGKVHDARVAALTLLHGADALLSADRDFSRFPALSCRNPL